MSTAVRRAIYGKLAGDTTLNNLLGTPAAGFNKSIYHQLAPQGAQFPFVIFQKQSGVPTEAFTDPSALETDIWMVKAVDRNTTADTADAIASRINVLLNDATLPISGATLLYLRRQDDGPTYLDPIDGVLYQHVGSNFRLVTTD